jgi:VanZ family protein
MFQKLLIIAAWTLLAYIASATISPIADRPTLHVSVSFEHLAAFAVVGVLFSLAYPRHVALVCLIVLGSAILLELAQLLTADRHARVHDAIEKVSGGALGIMLARTLLYFQRASLNSMQRAPANIRKIEPSQVECEPTRHSS